MKKKESPISSRVTKDALFEEIKKNAQGSDVRERTLSRMRKLLVSGAVIGLAVSTTANICDPPPEPYECYNNGDAQDYAESTDMCTAVWVNTTSGLVPGINIRNSDQESINEVVATSGAMIQNLTIEPESVYFECVPDGSVYIIDLQFSIICENITDIILFKIDISDTPVEGDEIPVIYE